MKRSFREARKCICNQILFSWQLVDGSIILREKFHPLDLTTGKISLVFKVNKSLMVCPYFKTVAKVRSPLSKSVDNCQELFFVYRVAEFSTFEGMRVISDWTSEVIRRTKR